MQNVEVVDAFIQKTWRILLKPRGFKNAKKKGTHAISFLALFGKNALLIYLLLNSGFLTTANMPFYGDFEDFSNTPLLKPDDFEETLN